MMLNLDDVRHHSEVGTGYTKDAMLNLCADEIATLRQQLAEHEYAKEAYETIIGKRSYNEVADELASLKQQIEERDALIAELSKSHNEVIEMCAKEFDDSPHAEMFRQDIAEAIRNLKENA